MVTNPGQDGFLQAELDPALLPTHEAVLLKYRHSGQNLSGSKMNSDPLPLLELPSGIGQKGDPAGQHPGNSPATTLHHGLTTGKVLVAYLVPRETHRHPGPRPGLSNLLGMELEGPNACFLATGEHQDPASLLQRTRPESAGDHGPGSSDREHTIDGKSDDVFGSLFFRLQPQGGEGLAEHIQPFACERGDGENRSPGVGGVLEELLDLLLNKVEPIGIDQIGLGDGHGEAGHFQKLNDGEVLSRLGHDALVRRHDQQDQIHPGGARQHVPDESLVARYIDHTEENVCPRSVFGEAEVYGDSPLPLLLQSVGIHAGECLDQSRFPMVDMSRRAQDESTHRFSA